MAQLKKMSPFSVSVPMINAMTLEVNGNALTLSLSLWREIEDVRTIDVFRDAMPDQRPPESPEEYVNHSLYLEAKTFLLTFSPGAPTPVGGMYRAEA